MINIHDGQCRNFGLDEVFRLVVVGMTVPAVFRGHQTDRISGVFKGRVEVEGVSHRMAEEAPRYASAAKCVESAAESLKSAF